MLPIALLLAMVIAGIYYYPLLPDVVATHFGYHGEPNGWMSKPIFFLINGGLFIFLYLLLTFLPFIDPLKKKVMTRFKVILLIRDATLVFFAVVFFVGLSAAHQGTLKVDLNTIIMAVAGLLFIVTGNYMPRIPQNWFVGIRTPWTISSEVVWKRTHILGGWLFVLSGVFWLVCAALKVSTLIPLVSILISASVSVLYSFLLFKKIQKSDNPQ